MKSLFYFIDTEAFNSVTRLSVGGVEKERRIEGGDPLARLGGARGLKTPTLSSFPNRCDMINHFDKVTNVHQT